MCQMSTSFLCNVKYCHMICTPAKLVHVEDIIYSQAQVSFHCYEQAVVVLLRNQEGKKGKMTFLEIYNEMP